MSDVREGLYVEGLTTGTNNKNNHCCVKTVEQDVRGFGPTYGFSIIMLIQSAVTFLRPL